MVDLGEEPAPGGGVAEIGSTFSQIPNTTIRKIPETISGVTVARRSRHDDQSIRALAGVEAANTPAKMPSGTTITNASIASLSECPIAVNSSGLTAAW